MAHKAWRMNGHLVEFTHNWWTGVATVTVDDEVVFERPSPPLCMDFGFSHTFAIGEVPCAVRVVGEVLKFRLEFFAGSEAESIEDANYLPLDLKHPLQMLPVVSGTLLILVDFFAAALAVRIIV